MASLMNDSIPPDSKTPLLIYDAVLVFALSALFQTTSVFTTIVTQADIAFNALLATTATLVNVIFAAAVEYSSGQAAVLASRFVCLICPRAIVHSHSLLLCRSAILTLCCSDALLLSPPVRRLPSVVRVDDHLCVLTFGIRLFCS